MSELQVSSDPLVAGERNAFLQAWMALEAQCHSSAFTSSHWIGAWLATLPPEQPLRKVVARDGEQLVALAILGLGWDGTWPARRKTAILHATGDTRLDTIFVEQNGLLLRRGFEAPATAAILQHVFASWPEVEQFRFDALESPEDYLRVARAAGLIVSDFRMAAPYVDLATLRASGDGYIGSLAKKARYAVRSARSAYTARLGPLQVASATSVAKSLDVWSRMAALNTVRHVARGHKSSFQAEGFQRFHRELIARSFESGFVDLLTVTAGAAIVGHLYLFRYRNRVAFYQCGFDYRLLGPRAQPGYAALSLAIEHYLRVGSDTFDFLAEATSYKLRLAQSSRDMAWLRFRRPTLLNRLEERGKRWWRNPRRR